MSWFILLYSGWGRVKIEGGKSLVYYMLNVDQQRKFAAKPDLFHTRHANYYDYYLSSFFMHSLHLRKMPRSNSKTYVEDKFCVKYQNAHCKACD